MVLERLHLVRLPVRRLVPVLAVEHVDLAVLVHVGDRPRPRSGTCVSRTVFFQVIVLPSAAVCGTGSAVNESPHSAEPRPQSRSTGGTWGEAPSCVGRGDYRGIRFRCNEGLRESKVAKAANILGSGVGGLAVEISTARVPRVPTFGGRELAPLLVRNCTARLPAARRVWWVTDHRRAFSPGISRVPLWSGSTWRNINADIMLRQSYHRKLQKVRSKPTKYDLQRAFADRVAVSISTSSTIRMERSGPGRP